MATVAALGARALRKLGLAPVAVADRPSSGSTVTVALIANRALRILGVNPIAESDAASNSGTVSVTIIAARALRRLGFNPHVESAVPAESGTTDTDDIAERALRMLGIVSATETPATEDQTLAAEKATAVHQHLLSVNFVPWAYNEIPASCAEHYVIMTAHLLAPSFGITPNLPASFEGARDGVRAVAWSGAYGQTAAEDRVTAVHEMLAALNFVSWASSAIPTWAADHYAAMASYLLAPGSGAQVDPAVYDNALNTIRTISLTGSAGQTRAETAVNAAHQTLNSMGFVTWATSAIPEGAAEHYAIMAAAQLAPVYGKPRDDTAYASAIAMVRRFAYSGATGQSIAEAKVRAAYGSLAARGLSRWTLASIPEEAEEPIVMMAAALLAPDIGEPAPPGIYQAGEAEIRRITALGTSRTGVVAEYY
jgi:hypothetical protein